MSIGSRSTGKEKSPSIMSKGSQKHYCSSPGCRGGTESEAKTRDLNLKDQYKKDKKCPIYKPFDPSVYQIEEIQEFKKDNWTCIAARIRYIDAPEFNGIKILVYRAPSLLDWINLKNKDPHFKTKDVYIYPIARFRGTSEGWYDALEYARTTSGAK